MEGRAFDRTFGSGEILSLAGYSIVPALLPRFIEAWSLTNTQAGWLAGIVSAGYMLAVIPFSA
jgi:fucose permease